MSMTSPLKSNSFVSRMSGMSYEIRLCPMRTSALVRSCTPISMVCSGRWSNTSVSSGFSTSRVTMQWIFDALRRRPVASISKIRIWLLWLIVVIDITFDWELLVFSGQSCVEVLVMELLFLLVETWRLCVGLEALVFIEE